MAKIPKHPNGSWPVDMVGWMQHRFTELLSGIKDDLDSLKTTQDAVIDAADQTAQNAVAKATITTTKEP